MAKKKFFRFAFLLLAFPPISILYPPSLVFVSFSLSGCQWNQGPEELERLVKEDPAFKKMILQRDQVHAQVRKIKEELLQKKAVLDSQVDKLRQGYDSYAKAQNQKIEQCRILIDTNRTRLKQEIETSQAQIETRQAELEGYQRTLADVQKVLNESKGITLSSQEKKKWEERTLSLNEKIRPLSEEIQELKLQVRLKKQKIGYLN